MRGGSVRSRRSFLQRLRVVVVSRELRDTRKSDRELKIAERRRGGRKEGRKLKLASSAQDGKKSDNSLASRGRGRPCVLVRLAINRIQG